MESVAFGGDESRIADPRVNLAMREANRSNRRPLTPFEKEQIETGRMNPIYIYNVSPIHEWYKPQGQLGTVIIPKRDWDKKVSDPKKIDGAVYRYVKNGITAAQPFIEGGMEIAEDVCGCSPRYDVADMNSNLTRFGVFISKRPFEAKDLHDTKKKELEGNPKLHAKYVVSESEQRELIAEANSKLVVRLQERILEADNWYQGDPEIRKYIQDIHRACLKAFNQITGQKVTKPWSEVGLGIGEQLVACVFCGVSNKAGVAKCQNCKEILNKEAYEALKKQIGA